MAELTVFYHFLNNEKILEVIRYTFLVKSGLPNRYKIRFGICPMRTLKSPREASLSIYSYNTLIFCAVARSDGLSRKAVSILQTYLETRSE
jgi:hypothetical protein